MGTSPSTQIYGPSANVLTGLCRFSQLVSSLKLPKDSRMGTHTAKLMRLPCARERSTTAPTSKITPSCQQLHKVLPHSSNFYFRLILSRWFHTWLVFQGWLYDSFPELQMDGIACNIGVSRWAGQSAICNVCLYFTRAVVGFFPCSWEEIMLFIGCTSLPDLTIEQHQTLFIQPLLPRL